MSDLSERGRRGGKARAAKLSPEERSVIASQGGNARWNRDPELTFLATAASSLSGMSPEARKRIFNYIKAKFPDEWPDNERQWGDESQ
jgi:hypothetical protein